jgi:hypothetical protein
MISYQDPESVKEIVIPHCIELFANIIAIARQQMLVNVYLYFNWTFCERAWQPHILKVMLPRQVKLTKVECFF